MRLADEIEGGRRSRGVRMMGVALVLGSVTGTARAQNTPTSPAPVAPVAPGNGASTPAASHAAPVPTSAPIVAPALAAQPESPPAASSATPTLPPPATSEAIQPVAPVPSAVTGAAPQPAPTQPAPTLPLDSAPASAAGGVDTASGVDGAWDGRYAAYPPRSPYNDPRYDDQRLRYRGIYVQPRIMGLFGVNFPHQFAENCPGLSCEVDPPMGFAGGGLVGWGWKNTGVHLLVMGMIDRFGVDVNLPPVVEADGGASGEAGGGFDFEIDEDGVSIDGSLFGDGSSDGLASGDEEPGDAHATRTGVAFGAGVQHAWFRRPVRLNTGLSAGAVRRTVKGASASLDSQATYTAPFVMADVGFAFGRRKAFMIGAMAFLEFVPKLRLERNGVFRNVPVITQGPQLFVGPYIAIQWGPKGRPAQPDEAADEPEEY